ncbi:cysteine protease [Xylographa soralifera]|nr:cysteine protease [Xylographa soralifera]
MENACEKLQAAEDRIHVAVAWKDAYDVILLAVEECLQVLRLTQDNKKKKELEEKCNKLLNQAQYIKRSKQWVPNSGKSLEESQIRAHAVLMKQPVSTRALSKREQIILLKGSKLHSCIYPEWTGSPLAEEFDRKDGELFTDTTSFGFTEAQLDVFAGWRRPSEALSVEGLKTDRHDAMGITPTMVPSGATDLVQDMTGDCSLVASLCAGIARAEAGHTKVISSYMFPYDFRTMRPAKSPNGKHIFKMQFNGVFRKVVIDDRLPSSRTLRSLHVLDRKNPGLLWPALLEKAYLKVMGGYDFPGSNSGTDIWILIGWIPEQLFLQSDDIVPSGLWRRVMKAYTGGNVLITLGTGKMSRHVEGESGMAGEHDYAVINLKEEDGRRFFLIKNPWSEASSWKESDNTKHIDVISESDGDLVKRSETVRSGAFWMEINDAFQHFETIYLSWNPAFFSHRQDIHFSWSLDTIRSPAGSFYRNPQYIVRCPEGGTLWLLLNKHFRNFVSRSGAGLTAPCSLPAFLSLYAFENDGNRVFTSDNFLRRSPYVDAPNTLLRLELPPKSIYTIVISEQDMPSSNHNFTLSAFSEKPITLYQAEDKYSHSVIHKGAWALSSSGGNSNSPAYHTNPQFSLELSQSSDLVIFLEAEDEDIPVHIKLLWLNGKRAVQVSTRDIVGDSGEYRIGSAVANIPDVQSGIYTLVCSTFKQGQISKFSLYVRSMSECSMCYIPLAEPGRLVCTAPMALFTTGLNRLLTPLSISRITRVRAHARIVTLPSASRSPMRMAIEYGQGPNKRVLSITEDGDFKDTALALRTSDVDILPRMCQDQGVWLVIERAGGSYLQSTEEVCIEILADHQPYCTLAWSLSFYPQPLLNLRRGSTTGSTIDYVIVNVLGFTVYTLSNSALLFSSHIRAQYAARNPISPEPTVRVNDVVFGAHAIVLSVVTLSMFWGRLWGLEQGGRLGRWRLSKGAAGIMVGVVVGVGWALVRVLADEDGARKGRWEWIDVVSTTRLREKQIGERGSCDRLEMPGLTWCFVPQVYALGYAKLVITVVKYVPQAWANYKRKSTEGWSILQILLDITGGVLSITQLLIDSSLQGDWSGVTGNPVKLGLGNVSICFDILFITQHYWLYRGIHRGKGEEEDGWAREENEESRNLLDEGNDSDGR